MATEYCVTADVEFVLSAAGVTANLDDTEAGVRSAEMEDWIDRAIDIAAGKINAKVRHQYKISDLDGSGNTWLRDTNAYLAAMTLATRRGNPCPESLVRECEERLALLNEIRWGRESIPEQAPSFDHTPAASNYRPELYKIDNPIRVDTGESTGDAPPTSVKRPVANSPTPY